MSYATYTHTHTHTHTHFVFLIHTHIQALSLHTSLFTYELIILFCIYVWVPGGYFHSIIRYFIPIWAHDGYIYVVLHSCFHIVMLLPTYALLEIMYLYSTW